MSGLSQDSGVSRAVYHGRPSEACEAKALLRASAVCALLIKWYCTELEINGGVFELVAL